MCPEGGDQRTGMNINDNHGNYGKIIQEREGNYKTCVYDLNF